MIEDGRKRIVVEWFLVFLTTLDLNNLTLKHQKTEKTVRIFITKDIRRGRERC